MQPEYSNTPLDHLCLAIGGIISAALKSGLITQEEYDDIHRATWRAALNHERKAEAA